MTEAERLELIDLATNGFLFDDAGNKIEPNDLSLQKKNEPVITIKNNNYDEMVKAISLITKSLEESKKLQEETAKTLLSSQRVIVTNTEKHNKEIIDAIKKDNLPVVTNTIKEVVKHKELEQWQFTHERDNNGMLVSTIANQIR